MRHVFSYPTVTPITPPPASQPPAPPSVPVAPAVRAAVDPRALAARQRELVRASLLHCPAPGRS